MTQINPFAPQTDTQAATQATNPQATAAATAAATATPVASTVPAVHQQQTMAMTMPAAHSGPSGVDDVSLDDDIKFNQLEKFPKMKKDEVARIAFIIFDERNAPRLKKVDYFYDKGANAIWNVPQNKAVLQASVAKYGEPKIKFGAIILKYETDQYGNLLPTNRFQLLAFTFSRDKWPALKSLHQMWGLQGHDLILTCREAEFQKIDIQPAPQCLFRANEQFVAEITAQAQVLHDKYLPQLLGRQMTDQEIMAIINGMPAGQGAVPGAAAAGMPAGGTVNPFAVGAGTGAPAQAAIAGPGTAAPTVPGAEFGDMVATR